MKKKVYLVFSADFIHRGHIKILKKAENETGFAKERSQIKVKQIESYGIKIKSLKLKKYCIIQRFLKCWYRTPNQTPNMPNQCVKASYKD